MSDFFRLEDDAPARRVLYVGAFLLIVVPFVQALSQLWPLRFSDITWRYGAANALSSVLLLPYLGLLLLLVMGRMLESRAVSRMVGIIATLFTLGLLTSFGLFILDALQLKKIVNSAQMDAFQTSSARVAVVTILFTITFALLALAGFRTPKMLSAPVKKGAKAVPADEGVGLIVGR